MKGGARRKTISSERQPSPPHPLQNELDLHGNDEVKYNKQKREDEQQQKMHSDGDDGNEVDEEEDEDSEEDDDQEVNGEGKVEEERPKLAEGFYEIEAVRKKRIRKGETQYLIKWRGWPETSNTWEPVENLMSCSDVIAAFDESLRSGKRRRKRKHAVSSTPHSKKKQKQQQPQQRSPAATYDVPSVKVNIIEEPLSLPSVHNSNFSNGTENHNIPLMLSPQIGEKKERNELDLKLKELKDTSFTNQENRNEFAIHIQEDQATKGVGPRIGAKRRKSGAVKRFKQHSNQVFTNDAMEKTTSASDVVGQHENQNNGPSGNGLDYNNMEDSSRDMNAITKIIKPVHYSASIVNGIEEVSVTFSVMRSDGQETTVDNKYLKATNPLLLINFYEQHLRYNE